MKEYKKPFILNLGDARDLTAGSGSGTMETTTQCCGPGTGGLFPIGGPLHRPVRR